ncbi:MAG: sarcosine oxidase subunit gamma [Acetobacteraceae bacterium]
MPSEIAIARCGPLDAFSIGGEAAISVLPPASRCIFRGRPAAVAAAGRAFGVALPERACRAAAAGDRAALWLGPDEWLLLAPADAGEALREAIEREIGDAPHSLVDVSHRQIAIEVTGAAAEATLNVGCPLDLDPEVFPVGMCTRTLLVKSEVVLWRTAPLVFRIEVWRSLASYAWRVLEEASREFRRKV